MQGQTETMVLPSTLCRKEKLKEKKEDESALNEIKVREETKKVRESNLYWNFFMYIRKKPMVIPSK